jgi:hypothetical protein
MPSTFSSNRVVDWHVVVAIETIAGRGRSRKDTTRSHQRSGQCAPQLDPRINDTVAASSIVKISAGVSDARFHVDFEGAKREI